MEQWASRKYEPHYESLVLKREESGMTDLYLAWKGADDTDPRVFAIHYSKRLPYFNQP